MKRRLISTLLVCLLLASLLSAAAAAAPTQSGFQSVTVASGYESTVTVTPLDASGNAVAADDGFYADAVKLKVDCAATSGAFYLVAALSDESAVPTKDNIQYIDQVTASGSSVSFTVYTKDLISGQTYSVYLSGSGTDFTALTKVASFAYYVPYTLGDVNGDDAIDSEDALVCLQNFVGLKDLTDTQQLAADVNGDGSVDSEDALQILKLFVGLIDNF